MSPVVAPIAAAAGAHVAAVLAEVEAGLRTTVAPGSGALPDAGRASLAAGGKRLRPLLAIVVAGSAAADPASPARAAVVRAGIALELTHTASLIHDDVLDASPLRRGRPTTFASDGRAAATCVGDALFAAAFTVLVDGADGPGPVRILAEASRALAQGELVQRGDAWQTDLDEQRYLARCELKTSALFDAAARLGALAAGEDPDRFAAFARALGLAFQLFDDVLDVVAPAEQTGKPRGSDILDGTATLPLLYARERDPELAKLDLRTVKNHAAAAEVCDRIAATGATERTEQRAREIVQEGLATLPEGLDDARAGAFELMARGVVDRRL
ncbi:MAG: polyprenyl synthetase family protein [Patulibacter sp.]|nr:polyprenyl synthetase family protein [Patulibacter sp.]